MKKETEKVISGNHTLTKSEIDLGRRIAYLDNDRSFSACIGRLIREEAKRKGLKHE